MANYYTEHVEEIKAICENEHVDLITGIMKFDSKTGFTPTDVEAQRKAFIQTFEAGWGHQNHNT